MNCKISIKKNSFPEFLLLKQCQVLIYIKISLKPIRFIISKPCLKVLPLLFLFCFALISEVFLGVGICLCGNNVGIAVEIDFLFILVCLCKKRQFVDPKIYQNICLQSVSSKQKHLMVNCFYLY